MKQYPLIANKIYNEPWLITREKHLAIQQVFEAHIAGSADKVLGYDRDEDSGYPKPRFINGVMVIPVHGILGKHLSSLEIWCGGCSVEQISEHIKRAEEDFSVREVIFDFRSPGGTVSGIPELANQIGRMRKRATAFADLECCSGAIWLASQAKQFYVTESAVIGSVGVYSIYLDRSKQLEEMGIKVNAISSGEFKLTGASFKPMTEEEREMLQARIDGIYAKFKTAITSHREIPDEYLQGQVFYGDEALTYGFCDGLVEAIEDLFESHR